MPDNSSPSKRFEVSITLNVKEIKDGTPTPFFENTLFYHDLPYDGLVVCEHAMLEALQRLGEAGIAQAMTLGLTEKLQAVGMGNQVASLMAKTGGGKK